MKNWLKGIFSKDEVKNTKEKVEKTDDEQREDARESLYEKHNIVSVQDGFLSEIQQEQENFMSELLGKEEK